MSFYLFCCFCSTRKLQLANEENLFTLYKRRNNYASSTKLKWTSLKNYTRIYRGVSLSSHKLLRIARSHEQKTAECIWGRAKISASRLRFANWTGKLTGHFFFWEHPLGLLSENQSKWNKWSQTQQKKSQFFSKLFSNSYLLSCLESPHTGRDRSW